MPVDDRVAVRKLRAQARRAAGRRSRDVHHPDPEAAPDLHDVLLRQPSLERRLVHVPVHGLDRRTGTVQRFENADRDEVAAVEDQISRATELDAARWKLARSAR
jgi:hypothetical protein